MHYLIRLIVEATTTAEANTQADSVMMDLIEWREFDWYQTDPAESGWEECWKPKRLNSELGLMWVNDAIGAQFNEFRECMRSIRDMVGSYSDAQIFDEKFDNNQAARLSRYYFSKASGYHANACQLYDNGGSSITNRRELEYYLKAPENLWVVQVDCHN